MIGRVFSPSRRCHLHDVQGKTEKKLVGLSGKIHSCPNRAKEQDTSLTATFLDSQLSLDWISSRNPGEKFAYRLKKRSFWWTLLRTMAYRLSNENWQAILDYLDARDVIHLLWTGDSLLRTRLKHAIRDLLFCLETKKSPSLSSLLSLSKSSSYMPRRFCVSLGTNYESLKLASEDYNAEKWKEFFPEKLESLELLLESDRAPLTSLFASLATVAPLLKTLRTFNITPGLTLPQSLKKLDFGVPATWVPPSEDITEPNFIESLPTTLTHLKICHYMVVKTKIGFEELNFKKMPLSFFHANINFLSLNKNNARWSILPDSIVSLSAQLSYGEDGEFFEISKNLGWKKLFPHLTSLEVPEKSLLDPSINETVANSLGGSLNAKQIESISDCFPRSLTALHLFMDDQRRDVSDVPPIIIAIGHQLRKFSSDSWILPRSALRWMPNWENPDLMLFGTTFNRSSQSLDLSEAENFINFEKNKNSSISLLYQSATSLSPGLLPASAVSFLPRTITKMTFDVPQRDPFSLASVTKAFNRHMYRNTNNDAEALKLDYHQGVVWKLLEWPKGLTKINLNLRSRKTPLHLGCFPTTLTKLHISASGMIEVEGGDLAHMTKLSRFCVIGGTFNSVPLIKTLHGLPRSLRSFTAITAPIAPEVFENEEFENFFFNLETLFLKRRKYSANVLLHLPKTLTSLTIHTGAELASWSENQFFSISRTRMRHLSLLGGAKWPETLGYDVFSRYMPKTLAILHLQIDDWKERNFEKEIEPHLPTDLLSLMYQFHLMRS